MLLLFCVEGISQAEIGEENFLKKKDNKKQKRWECPIINRKRNIVKNVTYRFPWFQYYELKGQIS